MMGRGGKDELGCTFWGQTELSVCDDVSGAGFGFGCEKVRGREGERERVRMQERQ